MWSKLRLLCLLVVYTGACLPARAAQVHWMNTTGGNWGTGANWDTGTVPAAGDDVFITANGAYTVTLNVSASVNSISVGGSAGAQTLSIPGSILTLAGASSVSGTGLLSLSGGTISGAGNLAVSTTLNW